jgi:hypothetical protein
MAKPTDNGAWQDPELCAVLAGDPNATLQQFGHVLDQETGAIVGYSPTHITRGLQSTILSYVTSPPRTLDGKTRWLTLLGYRQGGKSLAAELAIYPKAAYTPGWRHTCAADTRDRADTLHERVQFTHKHWPVEIRTPNQNSNETRNISFVNDSRMIVQSAHTEDFGIGQSLNSFHGSELPWWANAGKAMSLAIPSMINRRDVLMVLESTPSAMDESSAPWWKDQCSDARKWSPDDPFGRDLYAFFPFWDGFLNRRPWPKNAHVDAEELALLEDYGEGGRKALPGQPFLQLENLAFRREMFATDKEIRKNHDLFRVYYPFDDITCWIQQGSGVIKEHVLAKHKRGNLVEFIPNFHVFKEPSLDAVYVIGADPAGYGARDHAAFVVLEVWDDQWEVVATFSPPPRGSVDPLEFGNAILMAARKFNNALVGIERNGVGIGALALMQQAEYRNLYYAQDGKPGIVSHSHDRHMSDMLTALLDYLIIPDKDLVDQLIGYRSDKQVEQNVQSEVLGYSSGRRRERHHWDKVSALMMACHTAKFAPRRVRGKSLPMPDNVLPINGFTWNEMQAYEKKLAAMNAPRQNGRTKYVSFRKRRR